MTDQGFAEIQSSLANINISLKDTLNAITSGECLFGNNLDEVLKSMKALKSKPIVVPNM
jgi:hypothetical protein